MPALQRIVKPTTRKGKRVLLKREPLIHENVKTAMFIKGAKTSAVVYSCMKDMASLKKPNGIVLGRKNDIRPFEDNMKLEAFAKKFDSSLFMFGSHNKKRPHNLILGRLYDYHVLDMIELGIEKYKGLKDFKCTKISTGTKPILLFVGEPFEQQDDYIRLKNMLIDFYRGPTVPAVRLSGFEHALLFSAIDGKIQFRSYKILMKKSGTKIPRIELEEIGPAVDFVLRRSKLASEDLFKRATKRPAELKKKKVKNISKSKLGSKLGRIHMERQDLRRLQTRKLKGLKKTLEQRKLDKKLKSLKRKKLAAASAEGKVEAPQPKKQRVSKE